MTAPADPVLGEPLWGPEQVAEFLRIRPKAVWELFNAGRLPGVRVNRTTLRCRPEDVRAWVAAECAPAPARLVDQLPRTRARRPARRAS